MWNLLGMVGNLESRWIPCPILRQLFSECSMRFCIFVQPTWCGCIILCHHCYCCHHCHGQLVINQCMIPPKYMGRVLPIATKPIPVVVGFFSFFLFSIFIYCTLITNPSTQLPPSPPIIQLPNILFHHIHHQGPNDAFWMHYLGRYVFLFFSYTYW